MLGLVLGERVVEGTLHDVLQLDVEGGDHVITVPRLGVILRIDGHIAAVMDPSHQLLPVYAFEVVVVGTFDAKIVTLFFVGHAEHEAGEFLVGAFAADFLLHDDATLVDAAVEDDEALHLAQFRLGDVERYLVVAVAFGHALGEESLPFVGVALG